MAIADFLANIHPDTPWHLSAFVPHYHMQDRPPTPAVTLRRAWEIGRSAGLRYVYTGNLWTASELTGCRDTFCPSCGTAVIRRAGYTVRPRWQEPGTCPVCQTTIAGVWQ